MSLRKNILAATAALSLGALSLTAPTSPALAIGCLSGGAAGAVAGHYAGHHAVIGAIGGCIAGHHMHKVQKRRAAEHMDATQTTAPAQ